VGRNSPDQQWVKKMSMTNRAIGPSRNRPGKSRAGGSELPSHEKAEPSAPQTQRINLEQTQGGMWKVRDQSNLRGGLFRDYRAAARFIKHEFQLLQPSLVIVSGGKENPTS
jgi:hypothetical protein